MKSSAKKSAAKKAVAKKAVVKPGVARAVGAAVAHAGVGVEPHEHLMRVDARLAKVIERAGRCPLPERAKEAPSGQQAFRALVNAIVSQQLSGKAADTIFGRVEALGGGTLPAPAELLALPDETLRAAGLSGAKTRGVKDLAARVLDGSLKLDALHADDDEAVIEALTKVKGIGRWTAEMFLMFRLGRLDILSTADLGLRKGMMRLFDLREMPDPQTMEELSAHWRPFRSIGSWYLWRVAEDMAPVRKVVAAKKGATKQAVSKASAKGKTGATKRLVSKAPAKGKKVTPKRLVSKGSASAKETTSRAARVLANR